VNLSIISSMFVIGLVTSVHCVFMCGGLVLTYAVKGTEDGPWYRRLVPHLAYQGAKIVSYATVALLLGGLVVLLGRAVDITPFRNWLMVVAGIYMVLLGVGMTGKVKALRYLTPRPPKFLIDALSRNRKKASADAAEGHASLATPISFGLLTGLMPCAPLIAAQASAMATGSPVTGALAMVAFGLGTMPLMLVFGFASSLLSRQFQAKLQIVAALAVMIFGLVIFNRGLMVVGSPVTFDTVRVAVLGSGTSTATAATYTKGADGVVEIPLTIENAQYVPQTVSIPANTKVRLVVDRKEANACSAQLSIPKAGVLANLKDNGITDVDVPAMPAGSYTLTCGMGMISGSLSVGGGTSGGGGASPLLLPAVLIALIGGGYAVYSYRVARRSQPVPQAKTARGAGAKGKGAAPAGKSGVPGKAGTPAGKGARPGRTASTPARQPAAVPAAASLFGYEPAELVIGASVVVIASIIGLASGGFFH
jgi:sulfite exporter TauE/SafE